MFDHGFDVVRLGEGYLLLPLVSFGVVTNVFSIFVIRNKEAKLIKNFSYLLQVKVVSQLHKLN